MEEYGALWQSKKPEDSHQRSDEDESYKEPTETRLRRWALVAGIFYSIIIICGFGAELGIRGSTIDYSNVAETANNIRSNAPLFRRGLLLDVTMSASDIIVSVLLGFVFLTAKANPVLTSIFVMFRLMQQAIIAVNLLNMFAASLLLDETIHLPESASIARILRDTNEELAESLAFFFLMLHKYGYALALIFFGISMAIMGILILLDGVLPKGMGFVIALAGICYLTDSALYVIDGTYNGSDLLMLPVLAAEFGLTGWLIFGTPSRKLK